MCFTYTHKDKSRQIRLSSNDQRRTNFSAKQQQGMTLLEVILAIAIAGFVLTAATSFVVSVSQIWMDRESRFFFEDHVDGVTEFLQATIDRSGQGISSNSNGNVNFAIQATPNVDSPNTPEPVDSVQSDEGEARQQNQPSTSSLLQVIEQPLAWARPPGFAQFRDPLLKLSLSKPHPLLVDIENAPKTGISAYLYFDPDEGLSLLWHSLLQESIKDLEDLRRTLISPWLTQINYIYWDETSEKWETEPKPKPAESQGEYRLPSYLQLTFEFEGDESTRTLLIPVPSQGALIF